MGILFFKFMIGVRMIKNLYFWQVSCLI